jgi:hypothetical protein
VENEDEPERRIIHVIDADNGRAVVRELAVVQRSEAARNNIGTPLKRGRQSIVTVILTDAVIDASSPTEPEPAGPDGSPDGTLAAGTLAPDAHGPGTGPNAA